MPTQNVGTVKSAERALALIEFLASHGATSFTQILDRPQLPRSSAHSLLRTLQASGWIEKNAETKLYSLRLRAWQVGQQYSEHRDLASVAQPVMDRGLKRIGTENNDRDGVRPLGRTNRGAVKVCLTFG